MNKCSSKLDAYLSSTTKCHWLVEKICCDTVLELKWLSAGGDSARKMIIKETYQADMGSYSSLISVFGLSEYCTVWSLSYNTKPGMVILFLVESTSSLVNIQADNLLMPLCLAFWWHFFTCLWHFDTIDSFLLL